MKNKIDYVASYFLKTNKILEKEKPNEIITLQFFQRKDNSILSGINEVLSLLEQETDTTKYQIKYLPEGSKINNLDVVLELEGSYHYFGIWEGVIDGILSRCTSIATNGYNCAQAAKQKEIIFMGDRADHYINQEIDGKAIAVGGVKLVSTVAQNVIKSKSTFGSVPHVFLQIYQGDIVSAMKAYYKHFPNQKLIALVDYNNDVIKDSLKVWNAMGDKVWGVRIDTSLNMIDKMFDNQKENIKNYGVNVEQVKRLRKALDEVGATKYKIIVSSGFDDKKIEMFEQQNAPVDFYGVGQSIFKLNNSFSADATKLNGKLEAKAGRKYNPNPKLILYKKIAA